MDIAMLGWDCDSILIMNSDIILKNSFRTEYDQKIGNKQVKAMMLQGEKYRR